MQASGWSSLTFDSLVLRSSFEPAGAMTIFVQGDLELARTPFGDGLRCVSGNVLRLYATTANGDTATAPTPGAPSLSARAIELGDLLQPGSTRVYQAFYRDPDPFFCPEPVGGTWNTSNALRIAWTP
jgi:hypothetical protein